MWAAGSGAAAASGACWAAAAKNGRTCVEAVMANGYISEGHVERLIAPHLPCSLLLRLGAPGIEDDDCGDGLPHNLARAWADCTAQDVYLCVALQYNHLQPVSH